MGNGSKRHDEVEWNVAPESNAEVEREIAQKHGLVELLPLYDPKNSIISEEYRALEDPLASGLAFVRILIGPPPWMSSAGDIAPSRTADDIREYLKKNKKRVVPTPSDIGAMPGLRYVHYDSLMFEYVFAPDRRLLISVFPASTEHLDTIEAMIRTIRPIE